MSLSAQQQSALYFFFGLMYVFVIVELQGGAISATLSSAWGGFCVALQKGAVSPRLCTFWGKTDSQPAYVLISLCEIPEGGGGDSIKIINKKVRISPYSCWFWLNITIKESHSLTDKHVWLS